ncbi:MAG TPA: hypothetical protein VMU45_07860 [Candidatus Eisenbacteria bacterium]|nr:hypothetical protein [Candidatus Eisenbacteria bacterium]
MFNRITRNTSILRLNWYLNDEKALRSRWTVENAMLGAPHKPFGLYASCGSPDDVADLSFPGVPRGPSPGLRGSFGQGKL